MSQSGTIQLPALPAPKGNHNDGSDPATPLLVIGDIGNQGRITAIA